MSIVLVSFLDEFVSCLRCVWTLGRSGTDFGFSRQVGLVVNGSDLVLPIMSQADTSRKTESSFSFKK